MTHVCDTCGKPATQSARDVYGVPGEQPWQIELHPGPWRYGCNDHPVRSHIYDVNGRTDYEAELLTAECVAIVRGFHA